MYLLLMATVFGIAAGRTYAVNKAAGRPIAWYVWALYIAGAVSILFAFDTLINSLKEHELQAAWMGLGLFGAVGIVLIVAGRLIHGTGK